MCHAICHWMEKHQYGIRFAKFGTNDVVYVRAQNALYFDLGKEFVKLDHGELRRGKSRSPYKLLQTLSLDKLPNL